MVREGIIGRPPHAVNGHATGREAAEPRPSANGASTWLVVRVDVLSPAAVASRPVAAAPPPEVRAGSRTPDPVRIEEWVNVSERAPDAGGEPGVSTLAPAAIREVPGALDNLFHALGLLPGVTAVNDYDGKLAVRGAGPERLTRQLDIILAAAVAGLLAWSLAAGRIFQGEAADSIARGAIALVLLFVIWDIAAKVYREHARVRLPDFAKRA